MPALYRLNSIFLTLFLLLGNTDNPVSTADAPASVNLSGTQRITHMQIDPDTDVLQESLYVHIINTLSRKNNIDLPESPANKTQLLEINQRYYPEADLRADTLIIPYPGRKVKELSEIRYIIPADLFCTPSACLRPDISLSFNSSQSTVTINRSYPLSYYRSPRLKDSSLEQIRKAIEYIFNMILPCSFSQIGHNPGMRGIIYYQGYTPHEIILKNEQQFHLLWECLRREGSLYFYPSKVDDLEESLMIYGLLYVMNDNFRQYYHFGELTLILPKENFLAQAELKLIFYPFIKNIEGM